MNSPKNENSFYRWIKSQYSNEVPSHVDEKILRDTALYFNQRNQLPTSLSYHLRLSVAAMSLIIILMMSKSLQQSSSNTNQFAITESPEMILNYKTIEIMADASTLSDEDWKKIESEK